MPTAQTHSSARSVSRSAARWQEVVQRAEGEFASALGQAMANGRLDRESYRHWLAVESALSCTGALALERLADWHDACPSLRAAALSWARDLREDAMAATADLRTLGSHAPLSLPPVVAHWHGYVTAACGSPRAGEALGTVLLHDALSNGPAVTDLIALPPLASGSQAWLRRRQHPSSRALADERGPLCAEWSASALAAGARRAWPWYRAALAAIPGFGTA